jgi:hypothetical protein
MLPTAPVTDASSPPAALRRSHARRLFVAGLLVLTVLLMLRLWWGWMAERRWNALVAEMRAAGEPVELRDLQGSPVPNSDNAAYSLTQAIAAMSRTVDTPSLSRPFSGIPEPLPYSPQWYVAARNSIGANAETLLLVHQARNRRVTNWRLLAGRSIEDMCNLVEPEIYLRCIVEDAASYAHDVGDDATAIDRLRDLRATILAEACMPFSTPYLTASRGDCRASDLIVHVATQLQIAGAAKPDRSGAVIGAPRDSVNSLIEELLADDPAWKRAATNAFRGQAVLTADWVRAYDDGDWLLQPLNEVNAAQVTRLFRAYGSAMSQPNWQACAAQLQLGPKICPTSPRENATAGFLAPFWISTGACWEGYAASAERRMAAVILAIRLYYLDRGVYPRALSELVPDYLPAVPLDPMAADARPLGYILAARGARPVVYSVGMDGRDDTPDESALPVAPQYEWKLYPTTRDEWRDASAWQMPTSQPATNP